MKYDVDYFIKKFSAIPANKWRRFSFQHKGQSCVLGHCGMRPTRMTPEAAALNYLIYTTVGISAVQINDAMFEETQLLGATPKKRILTVLELIKAGVSV